jgi:hypothetical protein
MKNTTSLNFELYCVYKEFINTCKTKLYDNNLVLHNHHIIPTHLGGTNEKNNIVKLSVEDHINAHLLLANCFDKDSYENISNLRSARFLNKNSILDKETLYKIQQTYIGENNPFFGKTHTPENREKFARAAIKFFKDKTYEELYDENFEIEKQKRSDGVKRYWNDLNEDQKAERNNNVSKSLIGKAPWNKGVKYIYIVDDMRYETLNDALVAFGYTYSRKLYLNHKVLKIKPDKK